MCSFEMRLPRLFAKWNTEDQEVAKEEGPYTKISTTSHKLGVHTDSTSLKGTVHARCLHQDRCADPVAP